MADNSTQGGADTIRDKDRAGVKTQIFGTDLNIGGASEVLETAAALADTTANPTTSGRSSFGMLWNGTTWDRAPGNAASGAKVQSAQLPSALVSGRLDVNLGAITGSNIPVANVETLTDNAAFTDGTSKLFPAGYIFDETAGTGLTENDVAAGRVNTNRAVVTVTEDGVTRGRYATVKAASTAAAATDPAQVVSVSPNSPLPAGTNNIGDVDVLTLPAVAQGTPAAQANSWFVRPRKLITYRAVYRTTTAPYALSQALVASTRKQFATIHHAAVATKTVRIKGAWFMLSSSNAAALTAIDFIRITAAPATGNPAITPQPSDPADAAAEATCLTLPTTAGTEVAVGSVYSSRLISGAIGAATANPNDMAITAIDLLQMGNGNEYDHENKAPVIRAGVLEGWAVTLTSTGTPTVGGLVIIDFTEE